MTVYNIAHFELRTEQEPPQHQVLAYRRYLKQRLENAVIRSRQYQIREDTLPALERLIDFFACYYLHVRSVSTAEHHKKFAVSGANVSVFHGPEKGVMVFGGHGTGKSLTLKILSAKDGNAEIFHGKRSVVPGMEYYSSIDFSRDYSLGGDAFYNQWRQKTRKKVVIIDELGGETDTKNYGVGGILHDMIWHRYESYQDFGVPTIFSTNLEKPSEIGVKYGSRITTRMAEFVDMIPFIGDDWRFKNLIPEEK